ncbi:hypothetical protein LQZ18_04835 [Lachnospiraceae bacterium ZAX-1]
MKRQVSFLCYYKITEAVNYKARGDKWRNGTAVSPKKYKSPDTSSSTSE